MACKYSISQNYYATEIRHSLRSCSIGTNRVGLVELVGFFFFTCSIGNQPFSVGLVDQLFQSTWNPAELIENYEY